LVEAGGIEETPYPRIVFYELIIILYLR
jgi:hypothetical protein